MKHKTAAAQTARHITLSNEWGVVTELEKTNASAGPARYVLRCHKPSVGSPGSSAILGIPASEAELWSGFRYRDSQWSFIKFAARQPMRHD